MILCYIELIDVGGVRYERIPIPERSTVTPGVRRSRRKRVGTLDQRDMLQYQDHWGVTPSHRVGELWVWSVAILTV